MQDINFEQFPDFSNTFVLQSEDEDYTRHLFRSEVLTNFLRLYPQWWVEGIGYYMILYRPGKTHPDENMDELFGRGNELNRLLRSSLEPTQ